MHRDRRGHIRHALEIPVEIGQIATDKKEYLKNISVGGLCFKSNQYVKTGTEILIRIPLFHPVFKTKGRVVWCRKVEAYYEVRVEFIALANDMRIRMVEQVCHIENYKKEVFEKEGRKLSGEEAAVEWITKFAKDFPLT